MRIEKLTERETLRDLIYSKRPKSVGLIFHHGFGDTVMFQTTWEKIKKTFPAVRFALILVDGCGQKSIFGNSQDVIEADPDRLEPYNFDMVCVVDFWMSENVTGETKADFCCRYELGIPTPEQDYPQTQNERVPSPFVAMHCVATALPGTAGCPAEVANKIYQIIEKVGLIPLEMSFKHKWWNSQNDKFNLPRNVRNIPPSVDLLKQIIASSRFVLSVASGNVTMALQMAPKKLIYLKNKFDIDNYLREGEKGILKQVDVINFNENEFERFLRMQLGDPVEIPEQPPKKVEPETTKEPAIETGATEPEPENINKGFDSE